MKNLFLTCIFILAFGCNSSKKNGHVINDVQSPRVLYVVNAKAGTYEDEKLQLEDVASVIYFSDRPNRLAGHMGLKKFAKLWKNEEFKKDPPNAALSILKSGQEVVIELLEPEVEDTTITFVVKPLKGDLPKKFETSALFVDLASPNNQHFAYENFRQDFHSLDCSCADSSE